MPWSDLSAQVADEFCDAQEPLARRLQMAGWKAHTEYVKRTREAKRKYTLRQLRIRLSKRQVICCKNPKCAAEFVPWHAKTTYCTVRCRIRHLTLQAYYRRKPASQKRACLVCKKDFTGRRSDAVHCSLRCNHLAANRAYDKRMRAAGNRRAHTGYRSTHARP